MVLISHIYKFIYVKNGKVGGTSTEGFFEKYCSDPATDYKLTQVVDEKVSKHGVIGARLQGKYKKWYNHMPISKVKEYLEPNIFNSYFKFCVVRNPYDKMVSLFHFEGNKVDYNIINKFKNFCKNYTTNTTYIYSIDGTPICDYYIKYETLNDDIKKVCDILGITNFNLDTDLPKFNTTQRRVKIPYKHYYDEETKKIVYDKHKEEIEFFGYKF